MWAAEGYAGHSLTSRRASARFPKPVQTGAGLGHSASCLGSSFVRPCTHPVLWAGLFSAPVRGLRRLALMVVPGVILSGPYPSPQHQSRR